MNSSLTTIVLFAALVAGCTAESARSTSGGNAPNADPAQGGSVQGGGRLFAERLCEPLPLRGTEVEEMAFARAKPEIAGGTIITGTYVLSSLERFDGAGFSTAHDDEPIAATTTGRLGNVTLYVTGDTLRFVEAKTTVGLSYRAVAGKIETRSECPSKGATRSIAFSATTDTLVLHVDDRHREVYTRISAW